MNFDIRFTVTARCNKYSRENTENLGDSIMSLDIDLNINKDIAANFIFRFAPSVFLLPDTKYQVVLKFDHLSVLSGICLVDDEYIYVVKNFNQLLGDITEGYIRTRLLEKNSAMMEFDFETALQDKDGVIDEFALSE